MSVIVRRHLLAVSTCAKMHNHGNVSIKLTYDDAEPLAFGLTLHLGRFGADGRPVDLGPASYELYRESVHFWLLNAPAGSLLPLGTISLKVRLSEPHAVCFRLPAYDLGDAEVYPMFVVARDELQRFLADTYVVVPAEAEDELLNVDGCIAKLLA